MGSRLNLQTLLETILGSRNVYFDPPESIKLKYPCIIYSRANGKRLDANDDLYLYTKSYTVTVVDYDPDSLIPDKLQKLRYCDFDRHYTAENLHHFVFKLYY